MYLSIIIPVYNLSGYIARTLESVRKQGIVQGEVEVLVVNDGSTDDSKEVILGNLGEGFRLIDNETNRGVSFARNTGLDAAIGSYVAFLDGDDFLCENAIDSLLAFIKEGANADIIVMNSVSEKREVYDWHHLFKDGAECPSYEVFKKGYARSSVWGCAFKREYINESKLRFVNGYGYGEDTVFFETALLGNPVMVFKNIDFYEVTVRIGSVTSDVKRINLPMYRTGVDWLVKHRGKCQNIMDRQIVDFCIYKLINSYSKAAVSQKVAYSKAKDILFPKGRPRLMWRKAPKNKKTILLLNVSYFLFYQVVRHKNRRANQS